MGAEWNAYYAMVYTSTDGDAPLAAVSVGREIIIIIFHSSCDKFCDFLGWN